NGTRVLRYDLRENIPQDDRPGYWSEFSVHSILWDLVGSKSYDGDSIEQPFQVLWPAFSDLKQDRFVYLPYFLEHLVDRNPQLVPALTAIVRSRLIDFRPDARPSIANPFPQPIDVNKTVTGTVDSLSTQRMNLLHSADFFEFHSSGGPVSIRMDIT